MDTTCSAPCNMEPSFTTPYKIDPRRAVPSDQYTMDADVMIMREKAKMRLRLTRYGISQGIAGLCVFVLCIIPLGIDRGSATEIGGEIINRSFYDYDLTPIMVGLDVVALISAVFIFFSGFLPWFMANRGYDLTRTKMVFIVATSLNATLWDPVIAGSAIGVFFMRKALMWVPVLLCLICLAQLVSAIHASVYCCLSPWSSSQFLKKSGYAQEEMKAEVKCSPPPQYLP